MARSKIIRAVLILVALFCGMGSVAMLSDIGTYAEKYTQIKDSEITVQATITEIEKMVYEDTDDIDVWYHYYCVYEYGGKTRTKIYASESSSSEYRVGEEVPLVISTIDPTTSPEEVKEDATSDVPFAIGCAGVFFALVGGLLSSALLAPPKKKKNITRSLIRKHYIVSSLAPGIMIFSAGLTAVSVYSIVLMKTHSLPFVFPLVTAIIGAVLFGIFAYSLRADILYTKGDFYTYYDAVVTGKENTEASKRILITDRGNLSVDAAEYSNIQVGTVVRVVTDRDTKKEIGRYTNVDWNL